MKNIQLRVLLMNPETLLLISHYIYLQPNQDAFRFTETCKIVQSKHNIGFEMSIYKVYFLTAERQCNLSGIFLVKVKKGFTCDRKVTFLSQIYRALFFIWNETIAVMW